MLVYHQSRIHFNDLSVIAVQDVEHELRRFGSVVGDNVIN